MSKRHDDDCSLIVLVALILSIVISILGVVILVYLTGVGIRIFVIKILVRGIDV